MKSRGHDLRVDLQNQNFEQVVSLLNARRTTDGRFPALEFP